MDCPSEWLHDDIIFYLFHYVQIIRPLYALLISQQLFNRKQINMNEMSVREFEEKVGVGQNIIPKLYLYSGN